MKLRVTSSAVLLVSLLMLASGAQASNVVVDSINPNLSPCACYFISNYEGWIYTPTVSYTLTDLETKWDSAGNSGTVGVAIYSGWSNGPVGLLGSSTMFAANNNNWSTADFSPIPITAGDTYYLFFSGTSGIGANVNFSGPGTTTPYYYSDGGPWSYFSDGYGMFQFSTSGTSTPEPSTLLMLGSGVLGLAGVARRKLSL